jgi:glucosamine--fructose-6-phosphate aminotransferase (isomerizing)
MCGIVGALCRRDVSSILIEGLRRLEYRGYDSAGIAVVDPHSELQCARRVGKVDELTRYLEKNPLPGHSGIAHTRWATHGRPSEENAHPHICRGEMALVHNGIIENHEALRSTLIKNGYEFHSETDSEVIINLIHSYSGEGIDPFQAVLNAVAELDGAYAIGVIFKDNPTRMVAARHGSPLILGIGEGEYFIASDIFALLPVTRRYIILEEGDIADIDLSKGINIIDINGSMVERPIIITQMELGTNDKAGFRHYMLKEIHEQPAAIANTLCDTISNGILQDNVFGDKASEILEATHAVQIVACGTSYHAGLVASYWIKSLAGLPCNVDIASEYRYGETLIQPGTLFVTISQSGETADTLAALKKAKTQSYIGSLSICNVGESSITRESDLIFLTRAGVEIGVASTKAFTTQLVALMLLTMALAKRNKKNHALQSKIIGLLADLPASINDVLKLDGQIAKLAENFANKHHTLYLARGSMLPIALEGALKLKEISYIHAEAYPAGELKHGPLALVNEDMPVVVVAPKNDLLNKLISNLQEVRARGGELFVFADSSVDLDRIDDIHKVEITSVDEHMAPVIFTIPLQLFAYHVAVLKGADVDQPRNLAKSVTVE